MYVYTHTYIANVMYATFKFQILYKDPSNLMPFLIGGRGE